MNFTIGNNIIESIFLGEDEVLKIYVGSNLVYEKEEELVTLLDNGIDNGNWMSDAGSSIYDTYLRLVQNGVDDFVKCPTSLQPNTAYLLTYEVIEDSGWKRLNLWDNHTGSYIELERTVGTHEVEFTTQSTITENYLWFTIFGSEDGSYIDLQPINISLLEESPAVVGILASDYGLIPNDETEEVNNANKIISCLNTNGSIVIDDVYYVSQPTTSLTQKDIQVEGINNGELKTNVGATATLFQSDFITDAAIKNLIVTNLNSTKQYQLFNNSSNDSIIEV